MTTQDLPLSEIRVGDELALVVIVSAVEPQADGTILVRCFDKYSGKPRPVYAGPPTKLFRVTARRSL
jgi:hypothetical protein